MVSWFGAWGLVAALLPHAAAEPPAAPPFPAVAGAIRDLGDARFSVRQRAEQFLWQQGATAEPAVREAAAHPDAEVRFRVRRILEDFQCGILPGNPADINRLIRTFRDGNDMQRQAALEQLAARDQFAALQHLIRREPIPNKRRQLLLQLMQQPRAVQKLLEGQALPEFLQAVGDDRDEAWRRTVHAQLLFS